MAESFVLWFFIQSWAVVQRIPGCKLAGRGSLHGLGLERWAAAGQKEAAEGMLAGRG